MDCCHCQGAEKFFDEKTAKRDLRNYLKKGPSGATQLLLEALKAQGVNELTLLDVGGGVGVIQHELLRAGASGGAAVDASAAYLEAARGEARRQGLEERVSYTYGDFVELAPDVAEADIVTLDRVICCYPHMKELVGLSAGRARKLYGIIYPRDTWWTRVAFAIGNLYLRLSRSVFRIYIHATDGVDGVVRANGLKPHYQQNKGLWQVVLYVR